MSKSSDNKLASVNLISEATQIAGNIESNSDIRIDGELNGNLNTKGRLIIGEHGKIFGDVNCKTAEIEGLQKGKIMVETILILKSSARFEGDIETSQLQIEPGANFTGTCKMHETTK